MSDVLVPDASYINSIIGEGTRFNGEFDLNGLLRVDGDFCGTVRTNGKVLIGKNGRAECTIYAGTVVVGGIVRGNIFAGEKVVILSTGIVLGNVTSPRFIVEEGVIFNGNCRITQERKGKPAEEKAGAGGAEVGSGGAVIEDTGPGSAEAEPKPVAVSR
ncbi:MAG: polymer-forming cytoskeletal protein [Spirochaetales bacterium]|nr:polymer-forming cytoskeletal protein [Spirochaetales bacterium]